ncbi:acid-sensing ion channel 2-like [Ptychodera flava]|uniref:acid-sensing ion channel 2-like n=1 Tax=Ptychodera flava TaxID=63121 RepID=UPI00396A13AA
MEMKDNNYDDANSRKNNNVSPDSISAAIARQSYIDSPETPGVDIDSTPSGRIRIWAAQISDIHGVKHIVGERSRLRKLLWALVVLASFGILLQQCIKAAINYGEFHHVTKVDVEYVQHMPFPAITICNFNKYRKSAITPADMVHVGKPLGLMDEDGNLNSDLFSEEFVRQMKDLDWDSEEKKRFNYTEFTYRVGSQVKETIVECTWNGHKCTEHDFVKVFTHYGICFAFNKYHRDTEARHAGKPGADNGLRVVLNAQTSEHLPTADLEDSFINVGFKLMIHPPTEPPYPKELGFAVGPGSHIFLAITRQEIKRLSKPYGECDMKSVGSKYFDHYSMSACRIECETALLLEMCGCRLVEQPGNGPVCTPKIVKECAHVKLLEYIEGHIEFDCPCHIPCDSEVYSVTPSSSRLKPDRSGKSPAMSNYTQEYIDSNVLVLTIFYEELNFETITQLPETSLVGLLGQLGGNMGLFLGASILTLIQIIEYFVDECIHCFRPMAPKKPKRTYRGEDKDVNTPLSVQHWQGSHPVRNTTV